MRLNSERVDSLFGTPGAAQSSRGDAIQVRLVDWLNGQETRHSKLVYEADPFDSEWTARCLRQADLVLFVARSREDCTEAGSRVAHLSRVGDVSGK